MISGFATVHQGGFRNGPFTASEQAGLQADTCRGLLESLRDTGTPRSTGATSPGISSVEKATTAARSISFARSH